MTDLLGQPVDAAAAANLFTPDFGLPPHYVVGRETLLGVIKKGLGAGPRNPLFLSVLTGHRGSGKTVLLNEIEETAAQAGWVVLRADATTSGLYDRLDEEIRDLEYIPEAGVSDISPVADTEFGVNPGSASASRRERRTEKPGRSIMKKLTALGRAAQARGSAVLVSVDELQAGRREELRRLSADLQLVTKRSVLPVAFVGAGLPTIETAIMRDPKMTFFHRCQGHVVEALDEGSVLSFYRRTITDAGGTCANDDLRRMTAAAAGHPFKMQLIGDRAWVISGAPAAPIDSASVDMAIDAAETRMQERVCSRVWDEISDTDKAIVRAVAEADGTIRRSALGARLPCSSSYVAHRLRRLEKMGCVVRKAKDSIELGPLTPLPFMTEYLQDERSLGYAEQAESALIASQATTAQRKPTPVPRCGLRLKTKDAVCILNTGHKGRCRSR